MTITTTQKVIKIGDSKGTTLPARQLKQLGIDVGDMVEITIKKYEATESQRVIAAAEALLDRYDADFKNLASR